MLKVLGAFLLGVFVTVIAVRVLSAQEARGPATSAATCQPSAAEVEDLTDPRALDSRLDDIESEIAGPSPKP